jgi:hypothetical protein
VEETATSRAMEVMMNKVILDNILSQYSQLTLDEQTSHFQNDSFTSSNQYNFSSPSTSTYHGVGRKPPFETDPVALARRQKQIDYGKRTEEYAAYLAQVPK